MEKSSTPAPRTIGHARGGWSDLSIYPSVKGWAPSSDPDDDLDDLSHSKARSRPDRHTSPCAARTHGGAAGQRSDVSRCCGARQVRPWTGDAQSGLDDARLLRQPGRSAGMLRHRHDTGRPCVSDRPDR